MIWDVDSEPPKQVETNLIVSAASRGDLSKLKTFVERYGTEYTGEKINGMNSLHAAAKKGHVSIVEYLVEVNPTLISTKTSESLNMKTAAMIAAFEGYLDVVKILCISDCSHDIDDAGNTVLHYAAWGGRENVVNYIVALSKTNPYVRNNEGLTAAQMAAAGNHASIVRYLSEITTLDDESKSKFPLTLHVDVSISGMNIFHRAVQNGGTETVKSLLEDSSNVTILVESVTDSGSTPLHLACQHGHLEITELLLSVGARIDLANDWLLTPLHYACIGGYSMLVTRLLESGADVRQIDARSVEGGGYTCLHLAAQNGKHEVCAMLMERMDRQSDDLLVTNSKGSFDIGITFNAKVSG